jgi:hypothetical protein
VTHDSIIDEEFVGGCLVYIGDGGGAERSRRMKRSSMFKAVRKGRGEFSAIQPSA